MSYSLRFLIVFVTMMLAILNFTNSAMAAMAKPIAPFESSLIFRKNNPIDKYILAGLNKQGLKPAALCSDAVFIRRVFLDLIGTLPTSREVISFLQDNRSDKRSQLIDKLMARDEFADYWTLKWGDILRIKSEFPINLWPNAVQTYNRWIHDAIKNNTPYDKLATAMLVSSGSNFREPQVNFYRALEGHSAENIARTVALTFMGIRLKKCSETEQHNMTVFFSRVAYKKSAEWKEEFVYLDPRPVPIIKATFPDGSKVVLKPSDDPRRVFAKWLTAPRNPWFAKNIVNRIWAWLLGHGLIDPTDDIRDDNPPHYPEVLAYLEKELISSGYDLRHIYRLILNSRTYQQSSIPHNKNSQAEQWFACYPIRRLDAEVLADALCMITGTREQYSSMIPEPFTFVPADNRSIDLLDGSITSQFLETFGRPSRDTGFASERNNRMTDSQHLHMLNSTHIQKKLERSRKLHRSFWLFRKRPRKAIKLYYLRILSRNPTKKEVDIVEQYLQASGGNYRQVAIDLAWTLINTKEFLYKH